MSFLIGLKKLVLHSLNFNYWMKMAMSLPFVPPNYVLDVSTTSYWGSWRITRTPRSVRYTMYTQL